MRPIDADKLIKRWSDEPAGAYFLPSEIVRSIEEQPTADVVARSAYDQVRWERDTAIAQLAEIGKGFGETMDDVVEVVRCKDCKHFMPLTGYSLCVAHGSDPVDADDFCSWAERREDVGKSD